MMHGRNNIKILLCTHHRFNPAVSATAHYTVVTVFKVITNLKLVSRGQQFKFEPKCH
jgi:hypothetical protein